MLFGDPWRNVYEEIQNFKILKKNKNLSATKADIEFQFFNFFFFLIKKWISYRRSMLEIHFNQIKLAPSGSTQWRSMDLHNGDPWIYTMEIHGST